VDASRAISRERWKNYSLPLRAERRIEKCVDTQHIIDSHIHLWNPDKIRCAWLANVPTLNRPYLPADLADSGDQWTIDALVFVQQMQLPNTA
jgi:predicted TIM-barrel fold metal-dependent hydrolase